MTLPGDVHNSNQRGSLRYRLYLPTELNISNQDLAAAATALSRPFCTEGFEHFQVWVSTITFPSTLQIEIGGFHPDSNLGTFSNAVIGTIALTVASQAGTAYFGSAIVPVASSAGDTWLIGRFTRVNIRNTGPALSQGINCYVEATG